MDESLACTIVTSAAFFFNFVAYNCVFNFSKESEQHTHAIAMVILYSTFTICSISLTPILLNRIHPKFVMIMGSFGFIFYIATGIIYIKQLLYISSFINGIGQSLLWTSSQQIIIRCANINEIKNQLPHNSTVGYFEGIILCAFQLSYCVGNILPILFYDHNMSIKSIYIILCFITLLTPIILININHKIIRRISVNNNHYISPRIYDPIHDDTPSYNTFNHISRSSNRFRVTPINDENAIEIGAAYNDKYSDYFSSIRLWGDNRLQSIILLSIYWGFWFQFMSYEFPRVIQNTSERIQISILIGFVDSVLCFVIGKLSDYIHRFYLIIIGLLMHIIIYWMFYGYSPMYTYSMPFYCVIGVLIAIGDAIFTTTMFSIYPLFMDQQTETFSNCFFWMSLGETLAFVIHVVGFGSIKSRMIMYFMSVFLCSIPFFVSREAAKKAKSKFNFSEYTCSSMDCRKNISNDSPAIHSVAFRDSVHSDESTPTYD
eukprot:192960_1